MHSSPMYCPSSESGLSKSGQLKKDRHVGGYGSQTPHLLRTGRSRSQPGHPAGFHTLWNPEPPAGMGPVYIHTVREIYSTLI